MTNRRICYIGVAVRDFSRAPDPGDYRLGPALVEPSTPGLAIRLACSAELPVGVAFSADGKGGLAYEDITFAAFAPTGISEAFAAWLDDPTMNDAVRAKASAFFAIRYPY